MAVKVFGDDMAALNESAQRILQVLQAVPGASEAKVEQTTGLPVLTVSIDRGKAARYGLNVADIQDAVATAIGGKIHSGRASPTHVDKGSPDRNSELILDRPANR